ncbi:MAG: hypothetical protein JWQ73_282 [Variovorax sp.]|nr:hypothetical protein [Variovorax sp.]
MRVFVLALAILLLPVRGWLGDAMALESMQAQTAATSLPSVQGHAHDMHGTHELHGTGAVVDMANTDGIESTVTADSDAHHAGGTHDCQSTCTDCQLCHSIAIAVWPDIPALDAAPRETPAPRPVAFMSAERAPGFKPPIF